MRRKCGLISSALQSNYFPDQERETLIISTLICLLVFLASRQVILSEGKLLTLKLRWQKHWQCGGKRSQQKLSSRICVDKNCCLLISRFFCKRMSKVKSRENMKNIFICDQQGFTAMTDIWSNDQSPKKKSCKYEHLFTKNLHELPIKYEQYSLLKTGMIPNLFMNLVNFLLQRIKGSKLWKAFGHSFHHRHINNHNTMKNIMTPNSKDLDRNQIKLY